MMQTYIYRQDDPAVADVRYGRLRQRVERNGCGPVAICNVMLRLGKPQPFAAIIRDAQKLHMPWLFGLFGTKPSAPARYFRSKGIPFVYTKRCEDFCAGLITAKAAILCVWCNKRRDGIHFFTVINDGGRLSALNHVYADAPTPFSPQDVRQDRFITGYLFY